MERLIKLMDRKKLTLIVSLPDNSLEFAQAAVNGGADVLKVHCNVKHKASGVSFGTLEEERAKLSAILEGSGIPVGIVPGAEKPPTKKETEEIIKMGFDFIDMYIEQMPPYVLENGQITKIAAIDNISAIEKVVDIKGSDFKAVEAAIIPHLGYGQNLTIGDLQSYISIAISSRLPVIVPTQRKISVDEVPIITDTGVKALMIGAIVTGKTAKGIETATRQFREAVDSLE